MLHKHVVKPWLYIPNRDVEGGIDLDYTEVFDDILQSYCKRAELVRVKTIQLGAMLEMTYHVELKEVKQEKHMVDDIRCRNGNLNVIVAKRQAMQNEL